MDRPSTPRQPRSGSAAASPPARPGSGRRGYALAVLVAVVGATAAALWAVTGFLDQVQRPEQFARAEVPGVTSVAITQTGPHVVYVEGSGSGTVEAADLAVIGPQGAPVGVRPYVGDLRYDVPGAPGRVGTAVAVFDAGRTGTYQVGTGAGTADHGIATTATLAVGDDLAPEVIRTVVVPSVIGILALLAGIGLALATWINDERRNAS
ncbi:MAG TPA: hypothetical protein VF143_10910 [Candidatus Nanopelagicales bacterium]